MSLWDNFEDIHDPSGSKEIERPRLTIGLMAFALLVTGLALSPRWLSEAAVAPRAGPSTVEAVLTPLPPSSPVPASERAPGR